MDSYETDSSLGAPDEPPETEKRVTYSGRDTEDVTIFLQGIQRVALEHGRQRDDDWRADFVSTALTGPAMRWYMMLEDEERLSWPKLSRGLLNRFTHDLVDKPEESSAEAMSLQRAPSLPRRQGHVRVLARDGTAFGYLPRNLPSPVPEAPKLVPDRDETALVVEVPAVTLATHTRWDLKLVNAVPGGSACLGVQTTDNGQARQEFLSREWQLVVCEAGSAGWGNNILISQVWSIDATQGSEELCASWVNSNKQVIRLQKAHGPDWSLVFEPLLNSH